LPKQFFTRKLQNSRWKLIDPNPPSQLTERLTPNLPLIHHQ
jgi:hypothetical protein